MAGEFRQWLETSQGEHYQQTEYTPVDPRGDAYLIRKLDQVPLKLVKALLGRDDYHSADSSYDQTGGTVEVIQQQIDEEEKPSLFEKLFGEKDYEIGKTRSLDIDRLLNAYRVVINEFPEFFVRPGDEMDWSPEAERYMITGFWHRLGELISGKRKDIPAPLLMRSKLFLCLACGYTSRYMITGMEDTLLQRLMSYPDRTVQLTDAFRESYRLHRGDMFLTMLCLENVLAGNPYIEDRSQQPLQKKLVYLRNDYPEKGDNYGAWYHFHGIGLYGMIRSTLVARAVAEIESLGSIFLEGFDRQEDFINRNGARFGVKLRKMIDSGEAWEPLPLFARTDFLTQQEFQGGADPSDSEYAAMRVANASEEDRAGMENCQKTWLEYRKKEASWLTFWPGYGNRQKRAYTAAWIDQASRADARKLDNASIPPEARERLKHLQRDRWEKFRQYKLCDSFDPRVKGELAARAWLAQRTEEFALKFQIERQKALAAGDQEAVERLDASLEEFQTALLEEGSRPDNRPWWRRMFDAKNKRFREALTRLAPGYRQLLAMVTHTSSRPTAKATASQKETIVASGNQPVAKNSNPAAAASTAAPLASSVSEVTRTDLPCPLNLEDARQKMQTAYEAWVDTLRPAQPDDTSVREALSCYQFYKQQYENWQTKTSSEVQLVR